MTKIVNRGCSLWWCKRKHYAQRLCYKHYHNVYRHHGVYATTDNELKIVAKKCDELALIIMMLTNEFYYPQGKSFALDPPLTTICRYCTCPTNAHAPNCIVLTARDAVYDIIDDYNAKGREE